MSFEEMNIKLIYNNSDDEIIRELVVPLLKNTKKYYRGVGYFSSNWIKLVTKGLEKIVENNGRITLLTSPQLSEEDWKAINNSEEAKINEILYNKIKHSLENGFDIKTKEESLNLFAWLLADNYIEMKFLICKNSIGNYHDKIAIFEDFHGNMICLHGSFNDSLQATYNGEGVSVFRSWNSVQNEYVKEHYNNFLKLWDGENKFYKVITITEAIKNEITQYKKDKRPYVTNNLNEKNLKLPDYIEQLNDYQKIATQKIIENNWCGILEMATGTGKTITSLNISKEYFEKNKKIFLIVLVPYTHLVAQWEENIISFGYSKIIKSFGNKKDWIVKLSNSVRDFNSGLQKVVCVIATYTSAAKDDFILRISKIKDNLLLISDECHNIGSSNNKKIMIDSIEHRVGLSATPNRWFDENGTKSLFNYFKGSVFEYSLEEAIKNDFLTKYEYTPVVVYMNSDEYEEYRDLTQKINKLFLIEKEISKGSILERLILKRGTIISKVGNKFKIFEDMIRKQKESGEINHTLVYCAKGDNKKVTKIISELGIKVHHIVYEVDIEKRKEIIERFEREEIEVIVAIKCLDEGVDIPSTKTAYFLSSTSNPREFVQRRGRILRKAKDKTLSKIVDFIVFPRENIELLSDSEKETDKNIISKEMPRFAEFSCHAMNKYIARKEVRHILEKYSLEYLMDKLPWEVYNELKERYEDGNNAY